MTIAGLEMPPWSLWPPILQGIAAVVKQFSSPAVLVVVLVIWRDKVGGILDALVAFVDRATYLKLWGIVLKAPQDVRGFTEDAPELDSRPTRTRKTARPGPALVPRERKSLPNLAATTLLDPRTSKPSGKKDKSVDSLSQPPPK